VIAQGCSRRRSPGTTNRVTGRTEAPGPLNPGPRRSCQILLLDESTMGLDDAFEQIAHCFLSLCSRPSCFAIATGLVGQSGGEFVDDEGSVEAGTRLFGIMFRSQIAIRSTLWRPGSTPIETVTIAAGRRGVGGPVGWAGRAHATTTAHWRGQPERGAVMPRRTRRAGTTSRA
jgi:hypothetical protein